MSALDVQVGGGHYKDRAIQPVEYIHANKLDFFQGNVVKYVTRWRDKGGLADLEKARHYLDMYIELETKAVAKKPEGVTLPPGTKIVAQELTERTQMDQAMIDKLAPMLVGSTASDLYASDRRANE